MFLTAVAFYDVVVWVHIVAVVLAFGPTFAFGAFTATAEREGGTAVPAVGRAIIAWSRTGTNIGMIVILLSGIYLAADGWEFSEFFISWGFVAILILFGLVHGYFIPKTKQQVELAERDLGGGESRLSDEYTAVTKGLASVGTIAGLIVIATIYVMTAKPFL